MAYTQYRYKGRFISAGRARQLNSVLKDPSRVVSHLREKPSGHALQTERGYKNLTELRYIKAVETDRAAKAERRKARAEAEQRSLERERRQTEDFERRKLEYGVEPSEEPDTYIPVRDFYELTDEEMFPDLPEELPEETELLEDAFDIILEVADLDDEKLY